MGEKKTENPLTLNRDVIPDFLSLKTAPSHDLQEKWNCLIGIDKAKQRLLTQVKLSLAPDELSSWHHRWYSRANAELPRFAKRALLLGTSGSGKTTLAQGLAHAYSMYVTGKVYLAELGLVRSKFVGQTSKNILKAFEKAKEWSSEHPLILLLDELDSLANQRNFEQMHEDVREAVNTLIKELDGLDSYPVFVTGCSNLEGNIDEAVKRRFAQGLILRFGKPNRDERQAALRMWLEPFGITAWERSIVAKKTNDRTQCDVKTIVCTAVRYAYEDGKPLLLDHLLRAIEDVKPTGDY